MSQKRRRRTAEHHLTVIDRIALDMAEKTVTEAVQRREVIEDLNFRNLLARGIFVEERS